MTLWYKKFIICFLALLGGYSLYRHFVPPDWPVAVLWGVRVLLAGAAVGVGVIISRKFEAFCRFWNALSGRQRSLGMILGVLLAGGLWFSLHDFQLLQPVEILIRAPLAGTQVIVKNAFADDIPLRPTFFTADDTVWQWADHMWIGSGGTEGSLRWQGLARRDLSLRFATGPAAGTVAAVINGRPVTIELTAPQVGEYPYTFPLTAAREPVFRKRLNEWSDFVCALFLSGLLLTGGYRIIKAVAITPHKQVGRQQHCRRWLKQLTGLILAGAVGVMSLNYWIDPLQFYRPAAYGAHWYKEQRYQNPGLAKFYSQDTLLIGASTIEQYLPSEVEQQLHTPVLKLAVRGGSLYEVRRTLETALAAHHPQRVIWMLDYMAFCGPPNRVAGSYWGNFPEYMYEPHSFHDGEYLFSYTTTALSLAVGAQQLRLKPDYVDSFDMLNTWYGDFSFSRQAVVNDYQRLQERIIQDHFSDIPQTKKLYDTKNYTIEQLKATIDANILPLMAQYPDVHFDLVYAPAPIYFYLLYDRQDPTILTQWLDSKVYLANKVAGQSNVTIHDFQDQPEYLYGLDHYCDTLHFDQKIGKEIITSLQDKSHLVNAESIAEHNQRLLQAVRASDITN